MKVGDKKAEDERAKERAKERADELAREEEMRAFERRPDVCRRCHSPGAREIVASPPEPGVRFFECNNVVCAHGYAYVHDPEGNWKLMMRTMREPDPVIVSSLRERLRDERERVAKETAAREQRDQLARQRDASRASRPKVKVCPSCELRDIVLPAPVPNCCGSCGARLVEVSIVDAGRFECAQRACASKGRPQHTVHCTSCGVRMQRVPCEAAALQSDVARVGAAERSIESVTGR